MAAHTKSIVDQGFESIEVDVECHLSRGLPSITIVGLAGKAVDEAKERLRVAIKNTGLEFPKGRIVINLAPAELPKDTASLDLAMAIAILKADGQITADESNVYIGELGLNADIRPVRGLIGKLQSSACKTANIIILPKRNEKQASLTELTTMYCAASLSEVLQLLRDPSSGKPLASNQNVGTQFSRQPTIDINEIHGQEFAKRALEIAAAGGHNVLMTGPPGTGKSMLAKAFIGILPALTKQQALEVTHIHSLAGRTFNEVFIEPPLRSPHHTASDVAVIGGGHSLKPGEISLAHNGVLFLDELPEFHRYALESLRQPLEDGVVTIARAQSTATYPADFILVATSNPCPCGYLHSTKPCTCTAAQIQRYQKKLSGPILDRIDLHVMVGQVEHETLLQKNVTALSPEYAKRIAQARHTQQTRQGDTLNSRLTNKELKKHAIIDKQAVELLNTAAKQLELSARSYMRTLKLARTIADLDGKSEITKNHIAEALQYRPKMLVL